jgi:prepilin-type N-terminal cleavage/methylation domain-containing protein
MYQLLAYKSKKGFTLTELLVVVAIIGILMGIAMYNYPILLNNIKKRSCIANMRTIYGSSHLALMENPQIKNLSIKILIDKNYLRRKPVCPSLGKNPEGGFYAILDTVGKPLDVECVITAGKAHGSLKKLLEEQNPGGNDGGDDSSNNNSGNGE